MSTEGEIQGVEASKDIGILLNPLETGFESARSNPIIFPKETRIYNKCNNNGDLNLSVELLYRFSAKRDETGLIILSGANQI